MFKPLILFFIYFLFNLSLHAQNSDSISTTLINSTFREFDIAPKLHRGFITLPKSNLKKLNPLIYIGGGLLYVYQNMVSEQIQANCMYHVSCSENMKTQLQKKEYLDYLVV
jgi:uncharacterized protein